MPPVGARRIGVFVARVRRVVHMRSTSLVNAKAHLSELVDAAEHDGECTLIRRGKAAAAIVPSDVARPTAKSRAMTRAQAERRLDALARAAEGRTGASAVDDLLSSRR